MITSYGIFNYHELNNELVILFGEGRNQKEKFNDEISILKRDDVVVGYAINNFMKYAKIKYSGIIFLPNNALVDVINSILKNNSLDVLAYKQSSGYEISFIDGHKVVFAKEGTFLKNETISHGHVCTYDDLFIKNDKMNNIVMLDDESEINTDFFVCGGK